MAPKFEVCNCRIYEYIVNNVDSLSKDVVNEENKIHSYNYLKNTYMSEFFCID